MFVGPNVPGRLPASPWPADVRSLTLDRLPEALGSQRLVGIHCWAPWNHNDLIFARQLEGLRDGRVPRIDLYSMNIEDPSNNPLTVGWEVRNLPAFVVFLRWGRLETFFMGRESVPEFAQRIRAWLEGLGGGA